MQTINEFHWGLREDRSIKMEQVREKDIKVGKHYIYRGANTITRFADYNAVVKKITPFLIVMDICIDQSSTPMERLGVARSYSIAIQRSELGRSERLYRRPWDGR